MLIPSLALCRMDFHVNDVHGRYLLHISFNQSLAGRRLYRGRFLLTIQKQFILATRHTREHSSPLYRTSPLFSYMGDRCHPPTHWNNLPGSHTSLNYKSHFPAVGYVFRKRLMWKKRMVIRYSASFSFFLKHFKWWKAFPPSVGFPVTLWNVLEIPQTSISVFFLWCWQSN